MLEYVFGAKSWSKIRKTLELLDEKAFLQKIVSVSMILLLPTAPQTLPMPNTRRPGLIS